MCVSHLFVFVCLCCVKIFDKALDEPSYSSMYAQLCSRLHTYNPNSDINKDKQNTVSVCVYACVHVCVHMYIHVCIFCHRFLYEC